MGGRSARKVERGGAEQGCHRRSVPLKHGYVGGGWRRRGLGRAGPYPTAGSPVIMQSVRVDL